MAVHPFSTQDKRRPRDEELVQDIKNHCRQHRLNFSAVVLAALQKYKEEVLDDRARS